MSPTELSNRHRRSCATCRRIVVFIGPLPLRGRSRAFAAHIGGARLRAQHAPARHIHLEMTAQRRRRFSRFTVWMSKPAELQMAQERPKRALIFSGIHPRAVLGLGGVARWSTTTRRVTSPFR